MSFDIAGDEWHRALGVAPIPGRALAWLGGGWRPLQAPWLPIPADDPRVESLYPQRASKGSSGPAPSTPSPSPGGASQSSAAPLIPEVEEIVKDYGTPAAEPGLSYDPTDPYAHRRRRRRRD